MVAAREAGASPWEIHKRAAAGEFAPAEPFNPGARF
jgi:catechol 2,3-dioxygenase